MIASDRTVVVIEHDMDFLRRSPAASPCCTPGKVLSEGTVAEVQADPKVQEVYLGHAAEPGEAAVTDEPSRRRRSHRDPPHGEA